MSKHTKPVLGLLGGIGSGKSSVAAELARHGGLLINADRIGHEALRQPEIRQRVLERYGAHLVDAQGDIDRKKLGARVFGAIQELRALEAIVFPFIGARIRQEIAQARQSHTARFIILDAAVMLEAGWNDVCDKLIFVDAPYEARLARVQQQRAWSATDLEAREKLQMPLVEKRRRADAVIQNSGSPEALAAEVTPLLGQWNL